MVPFRLTHPGAPMKIPIHIDEGELVDLLSSQLKEALAAMLRLLSIN